MSLESHMQGWQSDYGQPAPATTPVSALAAIVGIIARTVDGMEADLMTDDLAIIQDRNTLLRKRIKDLEAEMEEWIAAHEANAAIFKQQQQIINDVAALNIHRDRQVADLKHKVKKWKRRYKNAEKEIAYLKLKEVDPIGPPGGKGTVKFRTLEGENE